MSYTLGWMKNTIRIARLLSSVRSIGSVAAAAVSDAVPMADSRQGTSFTRLDGPPADSARPSNANFAYVSEGFFEALNITLINGRTFTERPVVNAQGQPDTALINNILNNPANFYFNAHTALNPPGAVRGQLVRQ